MIQSVADDKLFLPFLRIRYQQLTKNNYETVLMLQPGSHCFHATCFFCMCHTISCVTFSRVSHFFFMSHFFSKLLARCLLLTTTKVTQVFLYLSAWFFIENKPNVDMNKKEPLEEPMEVELFFLKCFNLPKLPGKIPRMQLT